MEHYCEVEEWAQREFGDASLGDIRRTNRLVQIASGEASQVGAALSSVCGKSGSQAATRLFGCAKTTISAVTKPHIKQTAARCHNQDRILAVQDTTVLDFTGHVCTQGLGPVTTSQRSRGLLMHSVLAVSEKRVALGLLGIQVWARDDSTRGIAKDRRHRPVSKKESNKWLIGLKQAQSAVSQDQRMLVIGDRESDVYALFVAPRRKNVDLLVRMAHNRAVNDEEYAYVRDALESADIAGVYDVEIPRQGSRKARLAHLQVRIKQVTLKPPRNRSSDVPNVNAKIWLIWAKETGAPDDVDPLEWILLATEPVMNLQSAQELIDCYTMRWSIEEFHRILKSGCRVEQLQYDSANRLLPAIGVLVVVAWRVLNLTKQSRIAPDTDASEVASSDEIEVLSVWLGSQGEKHPQIRTVRDFAIAVARLGGFLGRKSDGMPGTKTTWQGLRNLEILMLGHKIATQHKM